jgi:hypothetical protein
MKRKIQVTFDVDSDVDLYVVKQIIKDAIGEFRDARTPVDEYVAKRYASHNEAFRQAAIKTVGYRCEVAESLCLDSIDFVWSG